MFNVFLPIKLLILFAMLSACGPVKNRQDIEGNRTANNQQIILGKDPSCPILFERANLCAQMISKQKKIQVIKNNGFILRFWSSTNGTIAGPYVDPEYSIEVIPWMRMPGGQDHGSNRDVIVHSVFDSRGNRLFGEFELNQVHFTMLGIWELWIKLKQENGMLFDEAVQKIKI